jgi:beta-glucanase (GH16 family)
MKQTLLIAFVLLPLLVIAQAVDSYSVDNAKPPKRAGFKLVFNEEFNYCGKPDTTIWSYELGFVRNKELQWYQTDNANCKNGRLLIEGRKTEFPNPNYAENSHNWKKSRKTVNYTSASINTKTKKVWKFGCFEVRARIDTAMGAWPAIWTLGIDNEWPSCGEIDMLEFYRPENTPSILANVASGTNTRWMAKWDMTKTPVSTFTKVDKDWSRKYHIWRMDWSKDSINLYIDDKLLNTTLLSETVNPDGNNPFLQPHYLLLNLALGENGGNPAQSKFPITFEVDYVRIYQLE